MASSVTSTSRMRVSVRTAVFIPCSNDLRLVFDDYAPDIVQFLGRKTSIPRQRHRVYPKFRLFVVAADVDVHRLAAVETVEVEPVRSVDSANSRHLDRLESNRLRYVRPVASQLTTGISRSGAHSYTRRCRLHAKLGGPFLPQGFTDALNTCEYRASNGPRTVVLD
jgi:hypothetical protein